MTEIAATEAIRAVNAANQTGQATVPKAADPAAVSAFEQALSTTGVQGAAKVDQVPFVNQIAQTWRASELRHQEYMHRINALAELAQRRPLSMGELSNMQYQLSTAGFQLEVTTLVAKKASDVVSTLVKNG